MHNELFPTEFACSIGIESKLMLRERKNHDSKKFVQRRRMMQSFQQMAVANTFKDCLIAFHGVELKAKHLKCLKKIYKSTRPWALGYATTVLLKKLESTAISGREAKEITAAIVEHLANGDKTLGHGGDDKFVIRATVAK